MNKSFGDPETRLFGNRINLSGFTNLNDCVKQDISKAVQAETDLIQKGEIEYAFGYGGGDMKVKKSGTEIVTAMTNKKTALENQLVTVEQKMALLLVEVAKAGIEANDEPYLQDGEVATHKRIKIYDYSDGRETKCTDDEATLQICRQYNDAVYKYYEYKRDINMLGVWIRNLDQKKSYDLTMRQLTILGF